LSSGGNFSTGLVSAVVGFVIALLVPIFFQIYRGMNAPWWTYVLLGGYAIISLGYDLVTGVINSIFYTIGFALGAYILHDYLALVAVIVIFIVTAFAKFTLD